MGQLKEMIKLLWVIYWQTPMPYILGWMMGLSFWLAMVNGLATLYLKWRDPAGYERLMTNIVRNNMGLPDLWEPPKK